MKSPGSVRSSSFLEALNDQDRTLVVGLATRRTFARGVFIFHKDSPGQTLYIIESGMVRIFALDESGQEITLNVYGPGDIVGELAFLDGLPRSAGAIAMTSVTALTVRREDFIGQLQIYPSLAIHIIELLAARLRYTTAYAENMAFLDVNGRVALRLLELADRFGAPSREGGGEAVMLRLTQAELASWVASTRETVNKVLCAFRDQRLIELTDQRIIVLDRRGLRRQAGR